jgi:hypothetical protein
MLFTRRLSAGGKGFAPYGTATGGYRLENEWHCVIATA